MPNAPSFVVNDRRKFTAEGDLRHEDTSANEVPSSPGDAGGNAPAAASAAQETVPPPMDVASAPASELVDMPESSLFGADSALEPAPDAEELPTAFGDLAEDAFPPGPTEEQSADAARAYEATVERLDLALRAADPGAERLPEMNFERLTQSLYTQALLLLGGAAQPGETPRVDILGARQTIDMLGILAAKTAGNLSEEESKLLESALFDLRMGFLEITQALARQAQQRQGGSMPGAGPAAGAGPRIVR